MEDVPLVARQASDPHLCARSWFRSRRCRLLFVSLRHQAEMLNGDPDHRQNSFQCSAVRLSSQQSLTASSAVQKVYRYRHFYSQGPPPLLCRLHPLLRR
jgi:hypothetical protein